MVVVTMTVVMIVIVAMMVTGVSVIVAAARFAASVFVWQGVFRCRASHFFFPAGLT